MFAGALAWFADSALGRFLINFLWGKIVGLIVDGAKFLWNKLSLWLEARRQKKQNDDISKGESDIDQANTIEDESERLKKKAEAACEIEMAVNPDSDCRR